MGLNFFPPIIPPAGVNVQTDILTIALDGAGNAPLQTLATTYTPVALVGAYFQSASVTGPTSPGFLPNGTMLQGADGTDANLINAPGVTVAPNNFAFYVNGPNQIRLYGFSCFGLGTTAALTLTYLY
jgi:hypothetical protein